MAPTIIVNLAGVLILPHAAIRIARPQFSLAAAVQLD
jgi:hypothetical protein